MFKPPTEDGEVHMDPVCIRLVQEDALLLARQSAVRFLLELAPRHVFHRLQLRDLLRAKCSRTSVRSRMHRRASEKKRDRREKLIGESSSHHAAPKCVGAQRSRHADTAIANVF